jgi:hypothetical protein
MVPAYHIPLRQKDLALIGEICAIQGQIEWMMLNTVRDALDIEKALALRIMGSTAIGANSDIWMRCVRKKQRNKYILAMAERAVADIKELSEGRNDFVHAAYFARRKSEPDKPFTFYAERGARPLPTGLEAVAVRVRNQRTIPVSKLQSVRDAASVISIRIAHVHWMTIIRPKLKLPSPWLHRLDELPPLDLPKPEPRKAKAQKSPHQSSAK